MRQFIYGLLLCEFTGSIDIGVVLAWSFRNLKMSQKLNSSSSTNYITCEDAVAVINQVFDVENLDIVNFRVEPFSTEKLGYAGEHKLLTIEVQREVNNCKSISSCNFFLKSIAQNSNDYHEHGFQEECEFFKKVLPLLQNFQIDPWAPQCYLVKNRVIVLENLKIQGFHSATESFTVDQLKAATATIARFHASSILLEHKFKSSLKDAFSSFFKENIFANECTSVIRWRTAGIEVAESVACDLDLDPKYVSMAHEYVLQGNHITDSDCNVLCHRDLWMNNLMFSEDDEHCRLVDFQLIAYASFAIDVLQLLYLNLDKRTRQKFEQQCMEVYHSVLKETLIRNGIVNNKIISLKQVIEAVEKTRIYGLISAVLYKPVVFSNKQLLDDFVNDPALNEYYMYVSRTDFVKKAMQMNQAYRDRVEESVKELVDYMKLFQKK